MSYLLLLLVTAVLYIRPSELHPALYALPLYELLIIPCLLTASPVIAWMLSWPAMQERPINACVAGYVAVSTVAALVMTGPGLAFNFFQQLVKAVLYGLLVAGVVNTPGRLRRYLYWLTGAYAIAASVAVLQYHGYVNIPALRANAGSEGRRLIGTGLFADPNDICLNLSCGIILALYGLNDRRLGVMRWLWLAPLALFGHTVLLTQSRGGLLAILTGLGALVVGRYGLGKGMALGMGTAFLLLSVVSGRQAAISAAASSGTGQSRIQMWFEAVSFVLRRPVLGIGPNQFAEAVGHVPHNSFIGAFAETGLVGGALFIGAFFHAFWTLFRRHPSRTTVLDPEVARARPYVMAVVVAFGTGMMTLSHNYTTPPFTILGIASATIVLARCRPPLGGTRLDAAFLGRTALVAAGFLALMLVYTRLSVRW